jgi:geranylgeranyl diphosphate synthase, type I
VLVTAPASLAAVAARIDRRLADLLAAERERWMAVDPDLAAPIDEIGRFVLAGGKRLRPAFCHWGFVGAGGDPDDPLVVDAGAALELLHAFALFHDDVMDDAERRRGNPTTHAVFRDDHEGAAWAGESRRFGEGVAILVGDLAFVYADQLLSAAPPTAWSIWNELRIELNIGQYLDLVGSARSVRDVERAERICRYKSGKYTVERPLHLGAALARPTDVVPVLDGLSAYGLPLGDAFQMRDDVMGAFGDPALTGKPVGTDLREGKPTPLLARAVAASTPDQRRVLDRVGAPDLGEDEVATIQAVIVATGALDELESHITALTATALAALDDLPLASPARDELVELAHYVSWRQS